MREALREVRHGFASLEEARAMVLRLRGTPPHTGGLEGLRSHFREGADGRLYFRWDVRLTHDAKLKGGGEGGLFRREAARPNLPVLVMRAEHSTLTTADQVAAFRAA